MRAALSGVGKIDPFGPQALHHSFRVGDRQYSAALALQFGARDWVRLTESMKMTAVRTGDLKSHGTWRVVEKGDVADQGVGRKGV